ncbi:MAG TPA: hypothetical protein VFL85_04525 [Candidatus Saccharimonadales bacterium]|nr:hypothetical protein [Candidatus Saccharimonadales bacterium]
MRLPNASTGEQSVAPETVVSPKVASYLGRISLFLLDSAESRMCGDSRQLNDKSRLGKVAQSLLRNVSMDVRLAQRLLTPNGQLLNRGYFNFTFVHPDDTTKVRKLNYMLAGTEPEKLDKIRRHNEEKYAVMRRHLGAMLLDTAYSIQTLHYGPKAYATIATVQPRVEQPVDIFSEAAKQLLDDAANPTLRRDLHQFVDGTKQSVAEGVWPDLVGTKNIVAAPLADGWRLRLIDAEPYPEHWVGTTWPDQQLSNLERLEERLGMLSALAGVSAVSRDPELPEFAAAV